MAASKRDYEEFYNRSYKDLEYATYMYNLQNEEQMIYETLCDNSPKDNLNNG